MKFKSILQAIIVFLLSNFYSVVLAVTLKCLAGQQILLLHLHINYILVIELHFK